MSVVYAGCSLIQVTLFGEAEDWTGEIFLGTVVQESDIARLAGEVVSREPSPWVQAQVDTEVQNDQETKRVSAQLAPIGLTIEQVEAANDVLMLLLLSTNPALSQSDYDNIVAVSDVLDGLLPEYQISDPCSTDCNPHRFYEVRNEAGVVLEVWYPQDCCNFELNTPSRGVVIKCNLGECLCYGDLTWHNKDRVT